MSNKIQQKELHLIAESLLYQMCKLRQEVKAMPESRRKRRLEDHLGILDIIDKACDKKRK